MQTYERALAQAQLAKDTRLQLTIVENLDFVLRKHGQADRANALADDLARLKSLRVRQLKA